MIPLSGSKAKHSNIVQFHERKRYMLRKNLNAVNLQNSKKFLGAKHSNTVEYHEKGWKSAKLHMITLRNLILFPYGCRARHREAVEHHGKSYRDVQVIHRANL